MRILHAPTHVGNQPWGISQAERRLGHDSRVLVYQRLFPGFGADYNLDFPRRSRLNRLAVATKFFLWASTRFDIFHFYFATTFFPYYLDLPVLRLLGKKIFCTFQGCDIRPSSACPAAGLDPVHHRHASLSLQQKNIRTITRHAQQTYVLNPDLLPASPTSSFLPYGSVDVTTIKPIPPQTDRNHPVVIFHAPSDRLVKGTIHLERAVHVLQEEGLPVRLDLVSGVSHDQVLHRAAQADLVVDQLLGGWYGAFAVEAMALGKPTLCYLNQAQRDLVPELAPIPIISVTPDSITDTLRSLIKDRSTWPSLGQASRAYVERVHDPVAIAQRLLADYTNVSDHA